ncbi:MFS phosphate transporter [Rasamsonia emersonii CBS 393.64]|uniref:MFS phosphate transporter n=1 Tax=Rasamsonia emersonii (strain ATCC 16479 / CBS 393.64 / IMI 116815) TaxID=1408163 RepID=A0A0F4Z329_RASE3|nr:MFS phosphate transporter [Rasamsonia emersonii CBS 393.64]KKA24496.1 MFS phosphate transporter [Rasamsonia emersonii CBS 393.64]
MADAGPNPPHGPDMTGTHPPFEDMNVHEKDAFDKLIRPDDSYTPDGVYWADLPLWKRIRFVTSYDAKEARRELGNIWSMIKADPLSPVSYYFKNMVLPGAGLGLEGYVLFSIGNVTPLLQAAFPACWKKNTICSADWINAINYLEIAGIIVGQIIVGFLGDWRSLAANHGETRIGRRWGLIQDAVIMFIGLVMLTAAWGVTQNGWVICYAWSLFFYGIGVGGEYPMTATGGMENAVGSGLGSVHQPGPADYPAALLPPRFREPPYSTVAAQWTYRVSFAIPAVGTLWLVYYRAYHMKAASRQLNAAKRKNRVTGYDYESLKLTFKYFGFRVLATAGAWFANDVFFYGNKLFQSQFISVLLPHSTSIMPNWLYNLLNVGVSLVGYYLASFLIDNKLYGRKWMQQIGFLMDFILFIIPAFHYKHYTSLEHIQSFQAMYFLSSFFNQFGPNSVTFLVAAEVFPAPIRATAHGISAAAGKLGALMAAILYAYIPVQERFYIVPWFGLGGMLLTFLFLPDTTGLDLKEQERRWYYIRQGREQDYHGPAVHPKHLSLWERFRGLGKNYDPELDYKQKIEEYRAEWEAAMSKKLSNEEDNLADDTEETLFEGHVHQYFERTSPMFRGMEKNGAQNFSALPPAATADSDTTEAVPNEK